MILVLTTLLILAFVHLAFSTIVIIAHCDIKKHWLPLMIGVMSSIVCLVASSMMFISIAVNKESKKQDKFIRINEVLYKKI